MSKAGFWLLSLLAVMTLSISAYGCTNPEPALSLDEQAHQVYIGLMCPLCPGQTIDQSQTELSAQMRSLVREKLEQGETREEILQFFVERYGEMVLAAPEKSGFNLIVWLTPILGIFAGGIVLWIIIRRRVQGNTTSSAEMLFPASDDSSDEKYYEQVEKDLKASDERGFR